MTDNLREKIVKTTERVILNHKHCEACQTLLNKIDRKIKKAPCCCEFKKELTDQILSEFKTIAGDKDKFYPQTDSDFAKGWVTGRNQLRDEINSKLE